MAKLKKKSLVGWIGCYVLDEVIKKLGNDMTTCKPYKQYRHNFKKVRITISEIK